MIFIFVGSVLDHYFEGMHVVEVWTLHKTMAFKAIEAEHTDNIRLIPNFNLVAIFQEQLLNLYNPLHKPRYASLQFPKTSPLTDSRHAYTSQRSLKPADSAQSQTPTAQSSPMSRSTPSSRNPSALFLPSHQEQRRVGSRAHRP
jgi:hypothetical protein